jgi:oxygen-independent coproporphyrinogen-3 oxidase
VRAGQRPVALSETIDETTAMGETMMLGLRLVANGVSAAAFRKRHGNSLEQVYSRELAELSRIGLVDWNGERVRSTHRGLLLANEVAARFLLAPTGVPR